jgi:ABC-2 type transport system ATP-binding protein
MISVTGLVKIYPNEIKALDGISFNVEPGEICGYIGSNGAGKSTTIKILCGMLSATAGQAVLNGFNVSDNPDKVKRFLGYVPESGDLFLSLTPYDFLEFVCRMYEMEKSLYNERIHTFMEMFGLKNEIKTPMFSFSKGMRQKVLIISSLIHNPDIIFWDEPMGGIDYTTSLRIRELMKELASMGKTFFYSTHQIESIGKICSRIIMIDSGKIAYDEYVNGEANIEEIFSKITAGDNKDRISSIYNPR